MEQIERMVPVSFMEMVDATKFTPVSGYDPDDPTKTLRYFRPATPADETAGRTVAMVRADS